MDDSDELMYSDEAAATRYLFYQGLNDINLFVEDAGKEYEYETIFKRLLGENYHIDTIFAAGGKLKVKELFKELGEKKDEIKNFYIVDGDFDRYIYPDDMINNPCFIYLKTYNIENYFLDQVACIQYTKGKLKCLDCEAKEKLDFIRWKETIVTQSAKLFLCYCFIKKYHPEIQTLSKNPYQFIDQLTGFERTDGAYQQYWERVLQLDIDAGNRIAEIETIYKYINGDDYFNLICGKFLFISLSCHVRSIIGKKFKNEDLRWHLINNFDISKLEYVKTAILLACAA